jgi:large subunit ribosomal protein L31
MYHFLLDVDRGLSLCLIFTICYIRYMKTDIHPKYNTDAKVTCSCGSKFTVGSTQKEINVEICSACHPFFTGNEKVIDAAGRVERFKARKAAAKPKATKKA